MIVSPDIAAPTAERESPGRPLLPVIRRWLLFAFSLLLVCPIRVWTQKGTVDSTWVLALNYARAHGLVIGSDVVWTMGPLSVYLFPQAIGNNLSAALAFQAVVWAIMALVLADAFRAKTTNPGLFTLFIALSAPLYWFNYTGIENLLIAAMAVLLTLYRWQGGWLRYIAALLLAGVVPLISFSAAVVAGGMLAGYLIEAAIRLRARVLWEAAMAIFAPASVLAAGAWLVLGSMAAIGRCARATLEFAGGYSAAMSLPGAGADLGAAAAVVVLLGVFIRAGCNAALTRFFGALFAIPLFAVFKHAFVRQDEHEVNFFCFVALALAVVCLVGSFGRRRASVWISALAFGLIWTEYMLVQTNGSALLEASGFAQARMLVRVARGEDLHGNGGAPRLDPGVRRVIGQSTVASLSTIYDGAVGEGLNLQIYPVIQRYAAYTPYLDALNAAWVRDKGPRFLIFDGSSIDDRQPWAETPAMWAEIYRWYRTRLLAGGELLLERRDSPRASNTASSWAADCRLTRKGKLESLFFRVPEVTMNGARVVPAVLASPMPSRPPTTLEEFGSFLDDAPQHRAEDLSMHLGGPGAASYACQLRITSSGD